MSLRVSLFPALPPSINNETRVKLHTKDLFIFPSSNSRKRFGFVQSFESKIPLSTIHSPPSRSSSFPLPRKMRHVNKKINRKSEEKVVSRFWDSSVCVCVHHFVWIAFEGWQTISSRKSSQKPNLGTSTKAFHFRAVGELFISEVTVLGLWFGLADTKVYASRGLINPNLIPSYVTSGPSPSTKKRFCV